MVLMITFQSGCTNSSIETGQTDHCGKNKQLQSSTETSHQQKPSSSTKTDEVNGDVGSLILSAIEALNDGKGGGGLSQINRCISNFGITFPNAIPHIANYLKIAKKEGILEQQKGKFKLREQWKKPGQKANRNDPIERNASTLGNKSRNSSKNVAGKRKEKQCIRKKTAGNGSKIVSGAAKKKKCSGKKVTGNACKIVSGTASKIISGAAKKQKYSGEKVAGSASNIVSGAAKKQKCSGKKVTGNACKIVSGTASKIISGAAKKQKYSGEKVAGSASKIASGTGKKMKWSQKSGGNI